jgi:hypothetical protein
LWSVHPLEIPQWTVEEDAVAGLEAMPAPTASTTGAPHARIGDADRESVARLVAEATGEGLLQFDEMDERLSRVLAARTGGELAAVTADLPDAWLRERRGAAQRMHTVAAARRGFAEHLRWYLVVMAGLVAVWATVGMTAGLWYPWPVWPALGWGLGLFSHARAAYTGAVPTGRGWGCHGRGRPAVPNG